MDPEVIDSPWPIRALVVKAFILPFRPKQTAEAYRKIWRADGSPLLANSKALATALTDRVDSPVALAMRYGQPSIEHGVAQLTNAGVDEILLIPLYPQHAASTRTTTVTKVRAILRDQSRPIALRVLPPFYSDAGYLRVLTASVRDALPAAFDLLLFSYHGLPERHIERADPTGAHCLKRADCCESPSPAHATCYRHQAFATSRAVARALELPEERWRVSFQSRLGRLPWLEPYTDQVLAQLPGEGIKKLVVACPAFVADNLETLEEIEMRGREIFIAAGGEALTLVPCLNARPDWIELLARWSRDPLPQAMVDVASES